MRRPTSREVVRRVLARVEGGSYATLALAGELSRSGLGDADRALATEICYGVLKRRLRLDRALAAHAPRGLDRLDARTLDALRVGAYQILFLRVPAHAAVDDAVGAVKRARGERLAGFANAVLRRLAASGEPPIAPPPEGAPEEAWHEHLALLESTPRWLVDRLYATLGRDGARAALGAMNAPAPTWLRANTFYTDVDRLAEALRRERPSVELRRTALSPHALAAARGGDLFSTEAYGAGGFLAQDLGAQLAVRLCGVAPGERILDACSGVGSKATYLAALAAMAGGAAHVDAADISARKLELLADHAHRLGAPGIHPIACDLTDEHAPLAAAYDRVLLDAPCSGLGVLRRHPEAKWRLGPDDLRPLAAMQARLLDVLARRVRPGGVLVYAVCTFTDEEGPARVAAFRAAHPEFRVEPAGEVLPELAGHPEMTDADGALRTWPHRDDADAFYAVRLRRA